MIINFSVENFGSIKEKQTLSFLANKSDHLEDYYIIEPIKGLRLNKLALIYGANASGKTTLLKALDFLRNICSKPFEKKTEKFNFEPFLFDDVTPNQSTKFELGFIQNSVRYFYKVEFNKNFIVQESLFKYSPHKILVFNRETDEKKELTSIKFGNKIPKKKHLEEILEIFTLWNNTVLGGFLKGNIDNNDLINVSSFFDKDIFELRDIDEKLSDVFSRLTREDSAFYQFYNQSLKKADFNINNVTVLKYDNEKSIKKEDLDFVHLVNEKEYVLKFKDESLGTRKYFTIIGYLIFLLYGRTIISIDELESSLHPDLFNNFLLTYLVNGKKESQLIATTHNREILNNRDLFRNDVIWFTDKNKDSATELYSLADFDSSVVRDTSNVFNAYKSGKLGGIPNLGDYYIDLYETE